VASLKHRTRIYLPVFIAVSFFTAGYATDCWGAPGGGEGVGWAPPGPFGHTVTTTSTVQLEEATYHGRLRIALSQRIDEVSFVMSGYETCAGTEEEDWFVNYDLTNWGDAQAAKLGSFHEDPLDCFGFFLAQDLEWNYAWVLKNDGATTVFNSDSEHCDLHQGGCSHLFGDP
jgi:hypothetical protein